MWELIRANRRKSVCLVIIMAVLLFAAGFVAGEALFGPGAGVLGLGIAFVIWLILTLVAFFEGKDLFMKVSGAHKIEKKNHPRLFNIVEEMSIASQLPAMPDIYIIRSQAPNAFATGRKPEVSAIAVTSALLNQLTRDELQGVIAHEIAHVKNRDILFMTMIGVMMGAIVLLSDVTVRTLFWGGGHTRSRTSSRDGGGQVQAVLMIVGLILLILAPILAQIIYLAASRKREYLADASAAQFTRYPEGLASALEKIADSSVKMKKANRVTAPMYIVNPLKGGARGRRASSSSLFSTHPPVRERIKILRSMAGGSSYLSYDQAYRKITGSSSPVLPRSARSTPDEPARKPSKKPIPVPVPVPIPTPAGKGKAPLDAVGVAALTGASVATGAAAPPEPETLSGKVRETTDALWKSKNYRFVNCDCGAILKVPATFRRPKVKCLRCSRTHRLEPLARGAAER